MAKTLSKGVAILATAGALAGASAQEIKPSNIVYPDRTFSDVPVNADNWRAEADKCYLRKDEAGALRVYMDAAKACAKAGEVEKNPGLKLMYTQEEAHALVGAAFSLAEQGRLESAAAYLTLLASHPRYTDKFNYEGHLNEENQTALYRIALNLLDAEKVADKLGAPNPGFRGAYQLVKNHPEVHSRTKLAKNLRGILELREARNSQAKGLEKKALPKSKWGLWN